MDIEQAREAKRDMVSVYATEDGTMDTAHHGIIVQVGGHESGRDDLVAIEGQHGTRWFPLGAVRLHPREVSVGTARYATKSEVIAREIAPALGDYAGEHDMEAIADAAYVYKVDRDERGNELLNTAGYEQCVGEDRFWEIVQRHAHGVAEDEPEGCEGHESLSGADMGVTTYCDGTCR